MLRRSQRVGILEIFLSHRFLLLDDLWWETVHHIHHAWNSYHSNRSQVVGQAQEIEMYFTRVFGASVKMQCIAWLSFLPLLTPEEIEM